MTVLHTKTPLFELKPFGDQDARAKMECFQPVGSFKIRGIGALTQQVVRDGYPVIYSSSGGNAGFAAAFAGRKVGIPVEVIVPETTKAAAKELIAQQGAQVSVFGSVWNEAHAHAARQAEQAGGFLMSPFDHEVMWDGHGTLIDEVIEEDFVPDCIVVSVGGGGLFCGVMRGLERNGLLGLPVIAVETEGTASFAACKSSRKHEELKTVSGVATSLGARKVCEQAYLYSQRKEVFSCIVSDERAVSACASFQKDFRVIVEPACGATLSLFYDDLDIVKSFKKPLYIACGGIGGY